jgi:hypothetical protein
MMEEKRSADADALATARSLPQERVDAIAERALALGLTLTVRNGGRTMELAAPIPR